MYVYDSQPRRHPGAKCALVQGLPSPDVGGVFRAGTQANTAIIWWAGPTTQEVRWKKDFQAWMETLKEFNLKGGNIAVGDDAGFHIFDIRLRNGSRAGASRGGRIPSLSKS